MNNTKEVTQLDSNRNFITTYPSYTTAAKALGVNESTVRKGVKDNRLVCGKFYFIDTVENKEEEITFPKSPKILLLDIETAPLLAFVFQKQVWKARIGADKVVSDWFCISWSAKFLNEDVIYSDVLTSDEALNEDDFRIMGSLYYLLEEAEVIIAHNGDNFDIPNINARLLVNGYPPPSPYRTIDTLKVAQQQFGFTHNSLNALAAKFGVDGKIETNFELWKRCIRGSEQALKEMETYNKKDVLVLEDVYLKFRPWIKGHVNLNMYSDNDISCTFCGSTNISPIENKFFYTQATKFSLYRCNDCQGVSRGKKSILNKRLISPIPR